MTVLCHTLPQQVHYTACMQLKICQYQKGLAVSFQKKTLQNSDGGIRGNKKESVLLLGFFPFKNLWENVFNISVPVFFMLVLRLFLVNK